MKTRYLSTARLSFPLASAIAALLAGQSSHAQSWSGATSGDWLTPGNWTGGVEAGSTVTTDTDIAVFGVNANNTVGINMTTTSGVYYVGAIDSTNATARIINNSSTTTAGILTLNGATVNSVANTILRNSTTTLLTLTNGTGSGTMGLELGNATTNTIQITSTGGITIGSIISGVGKSLRLQGGGAGVLTLSGANTYNGGTTLAGGTVAISNATSFGASTGAVTVTAASRINATGGITYANDINVGTQTLTMQNPETVAAASTATFSGVLSGTGTLSLPNSGSNAKQGIIAFTNAANSFTGNVNLSGSGSGDEFFSFNSIGDGGTFTFAKNGNRQGMIYTGSSNITFNTRTITVAASMTNGSGTADRQGMDGSATGPVSSFANNGTGTVSFSQNMVVGTIAAANYGVLGFGGSNTGNNTFSGNIADPTGTGKLAIGKFDAGKWILSGSNTYEAMAIIARGTLEVPTITTAASAQPLGINLAFQLGRGGDSGALSYTGGASSTDKQVFIGSPINATTGAGGGSILNNGTGALTFTNAIFNPLSTTYVNPGTGAVTGVAPTASRTLTLGGSNTGANTIQGVIQSNATNGTGLVALTKANAGTWVLSGPNSYTGLTTISGGVLRITNNTALGTIAGGVTVASGSALEIDGTGGAVIVGAEAININGGGPTVPTPNLGAIRNIAGNNTYGGIVTMAAQSRINSDSGTLLLNNTTAITGAFTLVVGGAGNVTISGAMTNGTGGLIKDSAGMLTLSGTVNSYTGVTRIDSGILNVAALAAGGSNSSIGAAAVTNTQLLLNGGTLQYTGNTATSTNRIFSVGTNGATFDASGTGTGTLSFTGTTQIGYNSQTTARTITLTGSNTGANTMSVIIGNNTGLTALTKSGAGTWILNGANTYSGTTTVTGGTLEISGSGSIANTPRIQINSSAMLGVTGLTGTTFTLGATQTLAGNGTVLATGKTVNVAGTLAPGASPGTITQDGGTMQLAVGGDYNWQIHDATAAAGAGYDTTNLINSGILDLSLLSASNTYNINLWSLSSISPNDVDGDAINFNNALTQSWTLFSTGTAISGFSTDKFTINSGAFNGTSGFSNALGGGAFSLGLADSNTDIVLTFTAVPEPNVAALIGAFGGILLLRRRR